MNLPLAHLWLQAVPVVIVDQQSYGANSPSTDNAVRLRQPRQNSILQQGRLHAIFHRRLMQDRRASRGGAGWP